MSGKCLDKYCRKHGIKAKMEDEEESPEHEASETKEEEAIEDGEIEEEEEHDISPKLARKLAKDHVEEEGDDYYDDDKSSKKHPRILERYIKKEKM